MKGIMRLLKEARMLSFMKRIKELLLFTPLVLLLPAMTEAVVPQVSLMKLVGGLSQPVHITNAGDSSGRIFVVEQPGRIRIIRNGVLQPAAFLDISSTAQNPADRKVLFGGEQGLLSVAFPPNFSQKGYFYVNYTRIPDGATIVARYFVTVDPDVADPASEQIILTVTQPFANHNGGQLVFGPDGFLYIGMGDGGSGCDPNNFAQNLTDLPGNQKLLGKLLRIDVESGVAPYAIPQTNPLLSGTVSEIWAFGLRNPWRFSFDRLTGDLYVGDVGQNAFEEIDFQPASSTGGENYGWNIMEGFSFSNVSSSCTPPCLPNCSQAGLTLPVFVYSHAQGDCSITGGMVYRGKVFKNMDGLYFYGDFCTGRIWGLRHVGSAWENSLLVDPPFQITSFGEDEVGQLYVTDYLTGSIYRIMVQPLAAGDFNGNGTTDLASLNGLGQVFYSSNLSAFVNVPGVLSQLVAGEFNGDGNADLAGLAPDGSIWISTDLLTWVNIPGVLSQLAVGDFNGDGNDDLAGLASNGSIWLTTNLSTWTNIPGILAQLVSGDFTPARIGDELAGLTSDGTIWFTTNLSTWTNIPGKLTHLVSGNFDGVLPDGLAGLASDGTIWFTTNLTTWTNVPGTLTQLVSGDFNPARLGDELGGLTSNGTIWFTTNLSTWTNIPGTLTSLVSGNFNGIAPDDLVGLALDGSLWLTTDLLNWTNLGQLP